MKKKLVWWFLVILWCSMIFYQSGKPAVQSAQESGYITLWLNRFFTGVFGEGSLAVKDGFIRKSAHFFEYMVLGCLFFNALKSYKRLGQTLALSMVFSVAYAISDEIHQFFVPGRAMRIFDIGVDSLGIALGTILLYFYSRKRLKDVV
ncbi:MAG: VanZ family protein [Clostridia bacterium]|nr:VanZ family protein [Clostridia bacterium]